MNIFSLSPKIEPDRLDTALEIMKNMAKKNQFSLPRFALQMAEDAPIPMWITTTDDKIIYVNEAYEKEFSRQYSDLVDARMGDNWTDAISAKFKAESEYVRKHNKGIFFVQTIDDKSYLVVKYPVNGNKVGGLCIPLDLVAKADERWRQF